MPVTTNVNMMTVVHAGSTGMTISFPDVCKTPTPAGPIPIPYPNIAQSSDTASGSSTVKIDKNPIMLKNSNFRMSTGDEAGSAGGGVISNTTRGKAEFLMFSFDVKIDGQNVPRLLDGMKTNSGSPNNTMSPAELQAPIPQIPEMPQECQDLKSKEAEGEQIACEKSGMWDKHFNKLKEIAKEYKVVLYIRDTAEECLPWIKKGHQPKPHEVFKGNTITPERVPGTQKWLDQERREIEYAGYADGRGILDSSRDFSSTRTQSQLLKDNYQYATRASEYVGVVGYNHPQGLIEPLKAIKPLFQDAGEYYGDKWITADYDLYEVLNATEKCEQVTKETTFWKLAVAINKKLKWDAIQHPPQTQWVADEHDVALGAPEGTDFPSLVQSGLANNDHEKRMDIPGRKGMKVFCDKVTVIAPDGVLFLEEQEDTFNALKCRECKK